MPSCGVSLMENFSLGGSLEQLQSSVGSRINTLSKCLRQIVPWMKKRESKFYGKDSTFAQAYQLLNSITNTVYLQSHFSLVKQLAQTDTFLKGCKPAIGQMTSLPYRTPIKRPFIVTAQLLRGMCSDEPPLRRRWPQVQHASQLRQKSQQCVVSLFNRRNLPYTGTIDSQSNGWRNVFYDH